MTGVGGDAVAEVDERVRACPRQRPSLGQPRERAKIGGDQLVRPVGTAVQQREPGRRRAERPCDADPIARPRAVAAGQLGLVVGPSHDRDRERQRGRPRHVATADRHAGVGGERLHAAHALRRGVGAEALRDPHRDVGLAGLGPHRGDVREGCRERAPARVGRMHVRVLEPEVDPVDHRVDADDLDRAGTDDRGVVADPAHDAIGAVGEQLLERGDQRALAGRHGYRWR